MLTGGDAVVSALDHLGVAVVFGVASVHNLPILDAVTRSGIRFVPARTESGAVGMADAYARVSGGFGVALTSTGPGAGNAAGALVEALAAGSRVIHITGQVETESLDRGSGAVHETKDQLGMLTAVSKIALRAEPGRVGEAIAEVAATAAQFPQGPGSVEIPIDLQYAPSRLAKISIPTPNRPQPDMDSLRAAVAALQSARRPAIWAGGGVTASGAGPELKMLLQKTSSALFTSNKGRGAVSEEHPQCVGNFANHPAGAVFLSECDFLLSVGTHFRANEINHPALRLPDSHVQVDIDPDAIGRTVPASFRIIGDAKVVLGHIAQMLETASAPQTYSAEILQLKQRIRDHARAALGPYVQLADALATQLRAPTLLVRDVTILSHLIANRLHPIREDDPNIYPVGAGIGQGLAMAIGAGLARPSARVLLMAGDGGFACGLGEMTTATQEGSQLSVLLLDDGGYGVLRAVQDSTFAGRRSGVDLRGPDFGKLAESMGWQRRHISHADEFSPAIENTLQASGPELLLADLDSIGQLAEPVVPRLEVIEPQPA